MAQSSLAAKLKLSRSGGSTTDNNRRRSSGNNNGGRIDSGQHLAEIKSPQSPQVHHVTNDNKLKVDERLRNLDINDPRGDDPTKRITKKANKNGNGRNTESFDPASTIVRPDIRVWVGKLTHYIILSLCL